MCNTFSVKVRVSEGAYATLVISWCSLFEDFSSVPVLVNISFLPTSYSTMLYLSCMWPFLFFALFMRVRLLQPLELEKPKKVQKFCGKVVSDNMDKTIKVLLQQYEGSL